METQLSDIGKISEKQSVKPLSILKETMNRHKLLSKPELLTVVKIEASLLKGARRYFEEHGFVEVVVPHLTRATGACENIATMFEVDYFGRRHYLSQTAQLYLEVLTPFLGKVWCIGPSFRAEPSVDERHLTEFTLIELEFAGDFRQLLEHIEGVICSMIGCVLAERKKELELLGVDVDRLKRVRKPFEKITYTEAIGLLADYGVKWGDDLKSIHEKTLVQMVGNKPLFVTHFPKAIKFFNMRENDENPNIVNSADLLLPVSGEAVGAAEREYRYEKLYQRLVNSTMFKQLIEKGGSIEDFDWYLDFYKEHRVLHSGCGIGLNRVTQYVLEVDDIRATTAFPLNRESIL
ncbi:asparagine--tRNA ligase [Candidatus Bathyarchaeota archaeon]|nr:asparagine--tRNA ligase [Candidatus Bathyarchaeota archaeon]MBS7636125.1 asparagine--tRNA ligase [Candidatus Bathyarchaeota archaeon]